MTNFLSPNGHTHDGEKLGLHLGEEEKSKFQFGKRDWVDNTQLQTEIEHLQPAEMSLAAVKEGGGVMEDGDLALTPIVVPEGQHYEVINDHCLVNTDLILACDEFRVEERHDEQEGEEKGMVGTHFPNRHDDSKLVGLSITTVDEEHNDEELGLGKSHKNIPSTGDQGVEIVQRGKLQLLKKQGPRRRNTLMTVQGVEGPRIAIGEDRLLEDG
ncbi:hypothetical protein KI387_043532, partial [Taxus chinensis]